MKNTNKNHQTVHIPVLLEEVLKYLDPKDGESYLDLTAGYGGHAKAVLERTNSPERAILVDRDQQAIDYLNQRFAASGAQVVHRDFLSTSRELLARNRQFDLILADLGVSSLHLDTASRGFSLQKQGPLDMRMDQGQTLTAESIVNSYSEADLAKVLKRLGEEPKAYQIARLIVSARPIKTTKELAELVYRAWSGGKSGKRRIHPATRTFQALRLAVNDELSQLEQALPIWLELLAPGGRIVVISFHSLEDRLVKQKFAEVSGNRYDAILKLLTKQPVTGSHSEVVFNPRARSAKLRAAVKIKTGKES
ncbi:MAG TPA: 16S rRNA (cytosine(1402)-N(4))-methyltransferase RsmH [Patescibacteria group bacterium]|nr:16S rRNA (cytosine(1402)-N(4))-methyltransferase RsmH [Patescibacteria group bacterium]